MSSRKNIDLIFSHNDFTENNVMVTHVDKMHLTLIDFEYSMINFRGYDLGTYVNETYIDYSYGEKPGYKVYKDTLIYKFGRGEEVELLLIHYLKYFY